jgi:hypothetical protein
MHLLIDFNVHYYILLNKQYDNFHGILYLMLLMTDILTVPTVQRYDISYVFLASCNYVVFNIFQVVQ